jgi:hypothetical protein
MAIHRPAATPEKKKKNMMMMMIWTKVFTPKINNPLMQKQSPTFMQLEASNPIGGKGWARRSHKVPPNDL